MGGGLREGRRPGGAGQVRRVHEPWAGQQGCGVRRRAAVTHMQYLGRYDEAEKWYKRALQIRPKDKDLLGYLQELAVLRAKA